MLVERQHQNQYQPKQINIMKNLNEVGLTELSEKNLQEVNGGISVNLSEISLDVDISDETGVLGGLLASLLGSIGGGLLS